MVDHIETGRKVIFVNPDLQRLYERSEVSPLLCGVRDEMLDAVCTKAPHPGNTHHEDARDPSSPIQWNTSAG